MQPTTEDINAVWERLVAASPDMEPSPEFDATCLQQIARHLQSGWLPSEIFRSMRWIENFVPNVAEELALRKMREVSLAVQHRLSHKES